jgi:hypothetical protein
MRALAAFPLLSIVIVLANALAFLGGGNFDAPMATFTLPSDASLTISAGHGLVLLGLLLLYGEVYKATRTGNASIVDHVLSLLVFVVALLEFLLVAPLGNGFFLALTLMTLIDVIAGFTVTISAARRDLAVPGVQ